MKVNRLKNILLYGNEWEEHYTTKERAEDNQRENQRLIMQRELDKAEIDLQRLLNK